VTAFEGVVLTGTKKEWTAQRRIRLLIGNTKGINASLNGRPVDMSRYSEPGTSELNFTAKGSNSGN
jgi:hypothetical protein